MRDLWAEKPLDFASPWIGQMRDSYNFVEAKGCSYEGVDGAPPSPLRGFGEAGSPVTRLRAPRFGRGRLRGAEADVALRNAWGQLVFL